MPDSSYDDKFTAADNHLSQWLDIESIFTYHQPSDDRTMLAHESVRDACKFVAYELVQVMPACAEATTAIRKIQEAMMFANSAIAQYGPRIPR